MHQIGVAVSRREFHLECRDSSIVTLNDEIYFVVTVLRPQVVGPGLGGLRADPDTEAHQSLKKPAHKGSTGRQSADNARFDTSNECLRVDPEEAGGKAGVCPK